MKFLCVECDEAMKLQGTRGPDAGAMTVIFGCPSCGRETAMLTNPMETQMVRSLGVKIGGRTVPAEPMEMVTSSLAAGVEPSEASHAAAETPAADPHHAMFNGESKAENNGASKCPFTGMVTEAYEQEAQGVKWSAEAEERVSRIPSFAQSMVRKSIEQHAKENGYTVIDQKVMDEVKGMFGM